MITVNLVLPVPLRNRLDALRACGVAGADASRSAVARAALEKGLEVLEREVRARREQDRARPVSK